MFDKGRILKFDFGKISYDDKSRVIKEKRPVVVLHSRQTPYKTVTIAPITKSESLKERGQIPLNYVPLKTDDYAMAITVDSFINLDMVATVDEENLEHFELIHTEVAIKLTPNDLKELDYNLAATYELQGFVKEIVSEELASEMEDIIEYIDDEIREKVETIKSLLEDETTKRLLTDLLEHDLLETLNKNYLKERA